MYYNDDRNYGSRTYEEEFATVRGMNAFISKVYGWMFLGLLLTAVVSYYVATSERILFAIFTNPLIFYGILIGQVILVIALSARITRMSLAAPCPCF